MATTISMPTPKPIRLSRYLPHVPTALQAYFMGLREREAMYGGAAGGGKSDALLMDASQFVDVPGYAALILRRSHKDLALPGAIMDRALSWWRPFSQIKWDAGEKTFTFPSGATITFGYLATANDRYRYQGSAYQYIGFDELTQFDEDDYLYLLSRLRREICAGPTSRSAPVAAAPVSAELSAQGSAGGPVAEDGRRGVRGVVVLTLRPNRPRSCRGRSYRVAVAHQASQLITVLAAAARTVAETLTRGPNRRQFAPAAVAPTTWRPETWSVRSGERSSRATRR